MIPNVEEKVALSFSKYLKGKSSKHEGDFYCMKCKNKNFCEIVIPSQKDKILQFN